MTRVTVDFDTTQYEFAHGRQPRGRGGWAFQEGDRRSTSPLFWANGTYSEAKRQAREHFTAMARAAEATYVQVQVCT